MTVGTEPNLKAISADPHITEPPNCYVDFVETRYRDRAPRMVRDPRPGETGEVFVVEGFPEPLALGLVAAAGRDPKTLKIGRTSFEELHRGGWDPKARIADQDRDGILAEMIYPTIGMTLCGHPDADYKQACMWAYNRWLEGYVAGAPGRLYGLGMTAVRSVDEAIADFRKFKQMGFKGVMMPGAPRRRKITTIRASIRYGAPRSNSNCPSASTFSPAIAARMCWPKACRCIAARESPRGRR